MLKIVPLLTIYGGKKPKGSEGINVLAKWTESDDINLLEGVEVQEVTDIDDTIDFSPLSLGNNFKQEQN